jgi:hypothetical protein
MYQPKTGAKCGCKRGVQRDNCPNCEGTGMVIDFKAIRERSAQRRLEDKSSPIRQAITLIWRARCDDVEQPVRDRLDRIIFYLKWSNGLDHTT